MTQLPPKGLCFVINIGPPLPLGVTIFDLAVSDKVCKRYLKDVLNKPLGSSISHFQHIQAILKPISSGLDKLFHPSIPQRFLWVLVRCSSQTRSINV